MTEKRVCLGKIVAAHGLRGEVKVHSYTDNPADIDKYGEVENKEATRKFKIKAVGPRKEVLKVYLNSLDREIGTVARFSNFGAGEIIEIKLPHRKETEMLPFTKQYVPTINLEEGYIIVSSATMIFAEDNEDKNGAEC